MTADIDDARAKLASLPAFAGEAETAAITRLAGMTNLVFRAGDICLRIPGKGTEEYINRANEAVAARANSELFPSSLHQQQVYWTVVGIPAKPVPVDVVHYSPGFMPYGTPCGEDVDPVRARIVELENEIAELRKEVAQMKTARQPQPKVKSA